MRSWILLAAVSTFVTAFCTGMDGGAEESGNSADVRVIHLKSGSTIEGRVLEITDKSVVLEFPGVPGSRGSISRSAVAHADLFDLILEASNPSSARDWQRLAEVAENGGLHSQRMMALRKVAELDPGRAEEINAEIEGCRKACSEERLGVARSFLDAGELERARRHLTEVMVHFKGCVAEDEARDLLKRITGDLRKERERAAGVMSGRRKIQEGFDDLRQIQDLVDLGERSLTTGRQTLEKPGKAIGEFLAALAAFERAWKDLGGFRPPEGSQVTESEIEAETARLRQVLRDDLVDAHLELGHAYVARSSLNSAIRHAGEAAALDPNNPGVQALRTAIAAARRSGGR